MIEIFVVCFIIILAALPLGIGYLIYKPLGKLFNIIEERITGVKKKEPQNLNLPLKELTTKLQVLSIGDTLRIYIYGFFPFIGWLLIPKIMKRLNLIDYYELRYNNILEKVKIESKYGIVAPLKNKFYLTTIQSLIREKRPFRFVRASIAKWIAYLLLFTYVNDSTHFLNLLNHFGLSNKRMPKQSFSEIVSYIKFQLALPFFESVFFQSSWMLILAGIFFYNSRYWASYRYPQEK